LPCFVGDVVTEIYSFCVVAAAVYGTTEFMVGLATNAHDDSANDSVTCMLTSCGQVADNVLIKVRRRTYALSRSTYNSGKDSSRL